MRLAEETDQCSLPEEMNIPEELKRREERLAAIEHARKEIEKRAQVRFEHAQAEYEAKIARREADEKKSGKKTGGKKPGPPTPRTATQRPGQPDRRGITHHALLQWRI